MSRHKSEMCEHERGIRETLAQGIECSVDSLCVRSLLAALDRTREQRDALRAEVERLTSELGLVTGQRDTAMRCGRAVVAEKNRLGAEVEKLRRVAEAALEMTSPTDPSEGSYIPHTLYPPASAAVDIRALVRLRDALAALDVKHEGTK